MSTLTPKAELAIRTTTNAVFQSTSVTTAVTSNACNTTITTQTYSLAAGSTSAFQFNNILINADTSIVEGLLAGTSSTAGVPVLNLSGQANGSIWIEITNAASSGTLAGTLTIQLIVYS